MKMMIVANMCYGITHPMSCISCYGCWRAITNIVAESANYDILLMINDEHENTDIEFRYLPTHSLANSSESARLLSYESQIKIPIHYLKKKTLSALSSDNNKRTIQSYNPKTINIAGFTASMDIIPTTLALMDLHPDVNLLSNCIADITEERKEKSMEYLRFMGVPFIK